MLPDSAADASLVRDIPTSTGTGSRTRHFGERALACHFRDREISENPFLVGFETAALSRTAHSSGVAVPNGFCLTANAFKAHLDSIPTLREELTELQRTCDSLISAQIDSEGSPSKMREVHLLRQKLSTSAAVVANTISSHPLPHTVVATLRAQYDDLMRNSKGSGVNIQASIATNAAHSLYPLGNNSSGYNIITFESLCRAVQDACASAFSPEAVLTRANMVFNAAKFRESSKENATKMSFAPLNEVCLGILVQQTIHPSVGVVGRNFDVLTREPQISLRISAGMPELIAAGGVDPDRALYSSLNCRRTSYTIGSKSIGAWPAEGGGMKRRHCSTTSALAPAVPDEVSKLIVRTSKSVAEHFGRAVGFPACQLMFVMEQQTGTIYLTRCSPDTALTKRVAGDSQTQVLGICTNASSKLSPELCSGQTGCLSAAVGRVKLLGNSAGESVFDSGDIVVAQSLDPHQLHSMVGVSAIIVEDGNELSPVATFARRHSIPCIVGAKGAVKSLEHLANKAVSVDATTCKVFPTTLPLQAGNLSLAVRSPIDGGSSGGFEHQVYRVIDGVPYVGKPEYPLPPLLASIYQDAWTRAEREVRGGRLSTQIEPHRDGEILLIRSDELTQISRSMASWTVQDLGLWLDRRELATREFCAASNSFDLTPESCEQLFDSYRRMISYFHLRWQVGAQVIEQQINDHLAQIPEADRSRVRRAFFAEMQRERGANSATEGDMQVKEFNELLGRFRTHADKIADGMDAKKIQKMIAKLDSRLAEDIISHAKRFKYCSDDLRNEPAVLVVVSKLLRNHKQPAESLSPILDSEDTVTSLGLEQLVANASEFSSHMRSLVQLFGRQSMMTDSEKHLHARHLWRIKEKLLELGGILHESGDLQSAEEVFALSPSQVISEIEKRFSRPSLSVIERQPIDEGSFILSSVTDWPGLLASLQERQEVLLDCGHDRVIRHPRALSFGEDYFADIQGLFALQDRAIIGWKPDENGGPVRSRFVQIFETRVPSVVDYAFFDRDGNCELVRGDPNNRKMPEMDVHFCVVQNTGRASRPARAGVGGRPNKDNPSMYNISRDAVINRSPTELWCEMKSPDSARIWAAMCNLSPILPNQEGVPTFPQPNHITFACFDERTNQVEITSEQNLRDLFYFYYRTNSSPSLRAQSRIPLARLITNQWITSEAPTAPKSGASQFPAHGQTVNARFAVENGRLQPVYDRKGAKVFILDENEVNSAIVYEVPFSLDGLNQAAAAIQPALELIRQRGDSTNLILAPYGGNNELVRIFIFDRTIGTPVPYYTNEFGAFEVGRGVVMDSPELFYQLLPGERAELAALSERVLKATGPEKAAAAKRMISWVQHAKSDGLLVRSRSDLFQNTKAALSASCAPHHQIWEIARKAF